MITHIYSVRALTNLHVGNGDAGYGVVDKHVQRDATTNYPTINMSGVKGALRQHFEDNGLSGQVTEIFGSEPTANSEKIQQGKVRFLSADLVALPRPVASGPTAPYELVYDEKQYSHWQDKAVLFNQGARPRVQREVIGAAVATAEFAPLAENLPVVARNYLDDGQSKNLWYEEFVPREAVFLILLQAATPAEGENPLEKIARALTDHPVVQLGGNATVGYGYCHFVRQNLEN